MTDTPDTRPPWVLRIVRGDGQGAAAGVPVTRLDASGNSSGYWVSDADGLVRIPPTDDPIIRVRVGLRNEAPIELTALRLFEGAVELQAPRDLAVAVATRTDRTSGAIQRPVTGGDLTSGGSSLPGQVLQFARLVVFAPPARPSATDQLPLLSAGDHPSLPTTTHAVDFFATPADAPNDLRYGAIVEVEQYWQPLGYATGDLLYSAALAPGDEARVAILDGRWGEAGPPRERPLQTLARLIGSPLLSDLVSEGSAAWPLDPLTIRPEGDAANALAQGAADTVRHLNERAARVAETVRRAPFRVGDVRADTPPDAAIRTVKNPRTDRLMTYHFFEPLQRYRVVARTARVRPAVLVPFRLPNQAVRAMVRQYGHVVRRVLLDRTLLAELDALLGLGTTGAGAEWERAGTTPPISELRLIVEPGTETAGQLAQIFCYLHADATRYTVHFFPAEAARGPLAQEHPEANQWIGAIRLADFHQHPLRYPGELAIENGSPAPALFQTLHVEGRKGDAWRRLMTVQNLLVPGQSRMPLASLAAMVESVGLASQESRLLAHITANLPHYAAAIIAAGDPAVRHLALSRVRDAEGRAVADVIENQVAGAQGSYLAFPLLSADLAPPAVAAALHQYGARGSRVPDEVVVTLPLPGVWLSAQASGTIEGLGEEEDARAIPLRGSRAPRADARGQ
ncbi:MAG TPA: hypothetical protein VJS20_04275 [Gemmatimonadales bacterium]|nr:hypothetical protein [Gemmatimonadales bacterium]